MSDFESMLLELPDILAVLTHWAPGTRAMFLTDGPDVYGCAVPASMVGSAQIFGRGDTSASPRGAWGAPMLYAPAGSGSSPRPAGIYNSSGFGGITRPYISGHLPYSSFGGNDGCVWQFPFDLPTLSTWNTDGDWLMITSIGDQEAEGIGAQGGYAVAEWYMGASGSPWVGFGAQNDSNGGDATGVFAAANGTTSLGGFPANSAYTAAGAGSPDSGTIGIMAAHMLSGVLTLYVALPDGIHAFYTGSYSPGAGAPPIGAQFVSQVHLFGSGFLNTYQRILVQGLIAGTMTTDQVGVLLYSILRGLPVYSPPCPCLPYGMCQLDGLQYAYNAPTSQNPLVRQIAATDTLFGRYYTDWGSDASRRNIVQTWPVMECCFYERLLAKLRKATPLSYIDDDGTAYTVLPESLTYDRKLPGGVAYANVTLKMFVVSQP